MQTDPTWIYLTAGMEPKDLLIKQGLVTHSYRKESESTGNAARPRDFEICDPWGFLMNEMQ